MPPLYIRKPPKLPSQLTTGGESISTARINLNV